jgi:hypothetical protein
MNNSGRFVADTNIAVSNVLALMQPLQQRIRFLLCPCCLFSVIAGLDPAIHSQVAPRLRVDARIKSEHDN